MAIQYRFFTIPTRQPEAAEEELNRFLRTVRVLVVHRNFVDEGAASFWRNLMKRYGALT